MRLATGLVPLLRMIHWRVFTARNEALETYRRRHLSWLTQSSPTPQVSLTSTVQKNLVSHFTLCSRMLNPTSSSCYPAVLLRAFRMPWSPTQAFPHPLANIQSSNADQSITNFMSYALVEMMTWQGLGDIINRFREKSLGLEPVSLMWAPGMASRLRIPYTYCWYDYLPASLCS